MKGQANNSIQLHSTIPPNKKKNKFIFLFDSIDFMKVE